MPTVAELPELPVPWCDGLDIGGEEELSAADVDVPQASDGRECPSARAWFAERDWADASPTGHRAHNAAVYMKRAAAERHYVGAVIGDVIAACGTSEAAWAGMWDRASLTGEHDGRPRGQCCQAVTAEDERIQAMLETRMAGASANGQSPATAPQDPVAARLAALKAAALTTGTLDRVAAVTPLVDGWLYLDTLAWGKGARGAGKSVMAIDMAGCIGTGQHWHGRPVRQGNVLYLILESVPGFRQRVRAWEALNGRPMAGVTFLPARLSLMDSTDAAAAAAYAAELRAVLVVVDTQARATPGAEENSNRDMGWFVSKLDGIREACGGCVLVLHHIPRDGDNLRGATALECAASTIIDVSGDGTMVTLRTDDEHGGRQKDAADPVPLTLELIMAGPGLALGMPRAAGLLDAMKVSAATVAAMLARCGGPESVKALTDLTGLSAMTVRRALVDLEEQFWAVRSGTAARQFWAATDLCRQAHQRQEDPPVNGVSTAPRGDGALEDSNRSRQSAPETAPGEIAGQEASHQGAPAPDQAGPQPHHAPHPYRGGAGWCGDGVAGGDSPREAEPAAPPAGPSHSDGTWCRAGCPRCDAARAARRRQVVVLKANGATNRQIADALGVSTTTVADDLKPITSLRNVRSGGVSFRDLVDDA